MLNPRTLSLLLRLRYRLLWAQTRSRNGKIALFFIGYLFVLLFGALLAMGGFGAAVAAVRSGQAGVVARLVLGGFFGNALISAAVLGFGMNAVFSDAILRRYPLTSLERLAARQAIAFIEPLWMLVLALDAGAAVGFYALGVSPFWLNLTAALLLALTNYLLARVFLNLIERLMNTALGTGVVLGVILLASLLPALAGPALFKHAVWSDAAVEIASRTPPFAAASVMSGEAAAAPLILLLAWGVALLAILFLLERWPAGSRSVSKAAAVWNTPYDRVSAWFGPVYGPLAGKVLRYYLRNNRVRYNLILAVPILAVITFTQTRKGGEMAMLLQAFGSFAILSLVGTAAMAVNQFGYDGGGFRRYFLLPVPPSAVFQASSLASLTLGGALLLLALPLWLVFSPVRITAANSAMLLSSALGGLFFCNAVALWCTLLAPRRCAFTTSFGNNLSLAGNLVVIGGVMTGMFVPRLIFELGGGPRLLLYWWTFPLLALGALGFYLLTLRAGAGLFVARRERLLAVLEGRE